MASLKNPVITVTIFKKKIFYTSITKMKNCLGNSHINVCTYIHQSNIKKKLKLTQYVYITFLPKLNTLLKKNRTL